MKFKGTVWMTALLAGVVLYNYLIDAPAEKKQKDDKERAEKILPFETDEVEGFRLVKKGQTIHLKRKQPDGWELLEPVKAKANSEDVSAFLSLFQATRSNRIVEESAKDLAIYGLREPSLKITLALKDRGEKTVLVGDDHPMNQDLYIKREEENKVLLAAAKRKDIDKSVSDFRDRNLLDFKAEEIAEIQFQRSGKSFSLNKRNEQWEIVDEVKFKGSNDEIMSFLRKVQKFEVKKFIDENPESFESYGLDAPSQQVTLKTGAQGKSMTLLVGGKMEDQGFHGKVADAKNVVLFGNQLVKDLSKKPVDFISKTLFEFQEKDVAEIQLRTPEKEILVARNKRDASKWTIEKPVESAADSTAVNSLLFDLKGARVAEFLTTAIKNPRLHGLDEPKRVLTVVMGGEKTWTLELGNRSFDEKHFFAGRTGDETVFTIAPETIDKLFRSLHDLKNKKLLSFKKDEVEKILIEYPGKAFELQKHKKGWSLIRPEKIQKMKRFIENDILWSLNNLEYQSIAAPLDDKDSGLDQPAVSVTIWKKKGQKLGKVTVGKKVRDKMEYYAGVEGSADLYKIKNRFLESLPKDLQKFKDK